MKTNNLYIGDCILIMNEKIKSNSVDLIFADPPYNLSGKSLNLKNNKTGGAFYKMNEQWDTRSYNEYVDFTNKWLKQSWRVLKNGGSLYVSCSQHNMAEIIFFSKKIDFKLNNIIIWYKTNPMPSITKRTFTHSTEYVCWFVKGKNWKFNYNKLKDLNPHRTREGYSKQMRDFLDFIEMPVLQGAERLKDLRGKSIHPTQKPERLLQIIIEASSDPGDIVLDPFLGSGTTAVVAERLGRRWIGIEKNKKYVKAAVKRINTANISLL